MLKKVPNTTKVFNSYFINDLKDSYTNRTNEKNCPVIYFYNNKKKNLMLMHLSKTLIIS